MKRIFTIGLVLLATATFSQTKEELKEKPMSYKNKLMLSQVGNLVLLVPLVLVFLNSIIGTAKEHLTMLQETLLLRLILMPN